jgi:hypothetical protein
MPRRRGRDRKPGTYTPAIRVADQSTPTPVTTHRTYRFAPLLCHHGVQWTACTICSKPVRSAS